LSRPPRRPRRASVPRRLRLPKKCPINFEFDVNRIECKLCPYFDACLRLYNLAKRVANRK